MAWQAQRESQGARRPFKRDWFFTGRTRWRCRRFSREQLGSPRRPSGQNTNGNATCTIARERASAASNPAADESKVPRLRTSGRATAPDVNRASSETGKVGNIVSAERENHVGSARAPAKEADETRPSLWANIMPESWPVRDSKSPKGGRIRKIERLAEPAQVAKRNLAGPFRPREVGRPLRLSRSSRADRFLETPPRRY